MTHKDKFGLFLMFGTVIMAVTQGAPTWEYLVYVAFLSIGFAVMIYPVKASEDKV
jgi:hypothetical protein